MLPVAILCGGYGSRAKLPLNKCFADVGGKPFLLHQLEWLESQGFTTSTLCRGTYGTLPALRDAADSFKSDRLLILYGDTLLRVDLRDFLGKWLASGKIAAVAMIDGVDAGVNACKTLALDLVDRDERSYDSVRDYLQECDELYEYEPTVEWVEVGTPQALQKARVTLGGKP